ncbi:probable polyadenylate-binding protein, cytoplasmic and nuclear [Coccomyxa sp. Obi]|nr:probable polyadenylate-binding protein, cytoplasmic and nuclear [Coccomyxa sp. Obi]
MAVQGMNGTGPGEQDSMNLSGESCSVFVNGLSPEVNSETLKEVFSKVGKVISAVVMRDQSGVSRGFGFVNFTKPEEAEKAIKQFNKVPHSAGTWLVRKAEKRKPEQKMGQANEQGLDVCNLYIRGLEPEISSARLQSMFEGYGKVVSSKVLVDPKTGASKCAGFLRFAAPEEADRAIHEMNNRQVGSKRLFVTLAQKRTAADPQAGGHPPFEHNAAQLSAPPGMAYFVPMPGMGAPQYQQATHGHPSFPPYGMYPPGVMTMHPQAFQHGYGPPQLYWPGMPMPSYPGVPPAYPQHDPRGLSRQQQAQQYYMVTSGQDGTYFDMASNRFMHSGRGYRTPMGRAAVTARGGARRGRQLFPEPPASNNIGHPRAPARPPGTMMPRPSMVRRDAAPGSVPKSAPASSSKDLLSRLATTPDKHLRISMMGDRLFTLVQGLQPDKDSAKITGMLLEMSEAEILHILEDSDALVQKVDEAIGVLKAAGYKETRVSKEGNAKMGPEKASSGELIVPEGSKAATASVATQNAAPSDKMEELKIS